MRTPLRMTWWTCVVVLAAVVGMGCSVPASDSTPRDSLGRSEIVLDESDANRAVGISVGESVTLNLEADPGSGFEWTISPPPDASVVQVDPPQFHPSGKATSGPGVEVWRFRAVGPGSVSIEMSYAPRSNPSGIEKTFTFVVSVT